MHSRSALLLACLAVLVLTVHAACSFDGRDFSALAKEDIKGSDGSGGTYDYYLRVCGHLSSAGASSCVQVDPATSACQIRMEPEPDSETFDIGNWDASNAPVFKYTDDSHTAVTYTMTGAAQCWAQPGPAQSYVAEVVLKCAQNEGPLTITAQDASCTKTYTYPTKHACGGGGGGGDDGDDGKGGKGLSGGWIFIIILLVASFVYVVAGCVYKSQKLGATGMDKCPNVEFWRDLPGLVKDGCSFTVAKLRSLCGGSRAGTGGQTYETM